MPLDKLRKQILDDANSRAQAMEDDANKQAEETIKQAKEKARQMEEEAKADTTAEIARREEEQKSNFELQERNVMLDARHRAVESHMPKLKSLTLKKVREDRYSKMILRVVEKSEEIAPQDELILTINKKDASLVKNFSGKVRYGNVGNGVELETKNGKIRIAATVEGLFDENRNAIETMLINEIFSRNLTPAAPSSQKKVKARANKSKLKSKKLKSKRKK